jgi:hypothetical protein
MTTPQSIGRASRAKGIRAERELAKYLRTWWPEAERAVVTGFRAGDHVCDDRGDIRGAGELVWQCKNVATLTDKDVDDILEETRIQTYAARAHYGIVVQRRQGKTDPGKWWAWLTVADVTQLAAQGRYKPRPDAWSYTFSGRRMPSVRMLLADVVDLLLDAGYGEVDTWSDIARTVGRTSTEN